MLHNIFFASSLSFTNFVRVIMSSLYVHIPYCARKCAYCDFYSVVSRRSDFVAFADAVVAEMESRSEELAEPVHTLYFGGGTPSLIPAGIFADMLSRLRVLLGSLWQVEELTVEANPDDVTPQLAAAWLEAGVNRVSLGVQSMADAELAAVGRRHDSATVYRAREALSGFNNVSADLIFGLPQQTHESLDFSISRILDLEFTHISAYSLMYEPGTVLTRRRDRGEIEPVPEDTAVDMFMLMRERLTGAGYVHYEISNFARPGFESRHNMAYWTGVPYIGLGPSAHSYDGYCRRRWNAADRLGYERLDWKWNTEVLTDSELLEEYLLTRMRTASGISYDEIARRFGNGVARAIAGRSELYVASGELRRCKEATKGFGRTDYRGGDRFALTPEGVMVSDSVILELSRMAEPD